MGHEAAATEVRHVMRVYLRQTAKPYSPSQDKANSNKPRSGLVVFESGLEMGNERHKTRE